MIPILSWRAQNSRESASTRRVQECSRHHRNLSRLWPISAPPWPRSAPLWSSSASPWPSSASPWPSSASPWRLFSSGLLLRVRSSARATGGRNGKRRPAAARPSVPPPVNLSRSHLEVARDPGGGLLGTMRAALQPHGRSGPSWLMTAASFGSAGSCLAEGSDHGRWPPCCISSDPSPTQRAPPPARRAVSLGLTCRSSWYRRSSMCITCGTLLELATSIPVAPWVGRGAYRALLPRCTGSCGRHSPGGPTALKPTDLRRIYGNADTGRDSGAGSFDLPTRYARARCSPPAALKPKGCSGG